MPMTDADYYQRRATQEVELAQRATIPAVTAAHYRLSTFYLDRMETLMQRTADTGAERTANAS